jgi:hypothetical protein
MYFSDVVGKTVAGMTVAGMTGRVWPAKMPHNLAGAPPCRRAARRSRIALDIRGSDVGHQEDNCPLIPED